MKEKKLIKEGQKGKHSQRTREVVQDSTKSAETSCKEETTMRRPEDTATPAEIIAMMQKEYPHLNPRLGRADDPELSELMVYFKPESTKSKTHTQKKNRGRT